MNNTDFYNNNAEQFYSGTIDVDMNHLYTPFLEHIPENGSILDAGCGSGRDSLYFKNNGYAVTAFDASEQMVNMSSQLISQKTLHLRFEDITFHNEFHGIWASASLLHVSRSDMFPVFQKLITALKPDGILYISFKYEADDIIKNNRSFTCYTEHTFSEFIENFAQLKPIHIWKTSDARPHRKNEFWLNALIKI